MPVLWPGGKGLGFKKHRPGDLCSWMLGPASGSGGGLIGRPAVRPLQVRDLSTVLGERLADRAYEMEDAPMVFEAQALGPGPGIRSTATFRWRSIQTALGNPL